MALDDIEIPSISMALRSVMHELAAAYEYACAEYGEDSVHAVMLSDAIMFMRGWMRRYSAGTQQK